MSMKYFNNSIGNRSRDLQVCTAVRCAEVSDHNHTPEAFLQLKASPGKNEQGA
jgi:hypothetical protein